MISKAYSLMSDFMSQNLMSRVRGMLVGEIQSLGMPALTLLLYSSRSLRDSSAFTFMFKYNVSPNLKLNWAQTNPKRITQLW